MSTIKDQEGVPFSSVAITDPIVGDRIEQQTITGSEAGGNIAVDTIQGEEFGQFSKVTVGIQPGNDVVVMDGIDLTWRLYVGHSVATSAPFRVDKDGALTATGATITGSITATSGAIGGWTISATALKAGSGANTVGLDSGGTNPSIYAGSATPASAPFRVTKAGVVTATSGTIGGWTLRATTIASASNEIVLDAGNKRIEVGTGDEILIDGTNKRIRSSNYVSGFAGSGFTLDSDLLEVGNIAARGMIRTAVFQKDVISAVGGNLLVLPADKLEDDMTALDASALVTEGNTAYAVNSILRMKDGTDDEWLEVDSITYE